MSNKTTNVGGIELEINNEKTDYVPHTEPFVEHRKVLETLALGIKENLPVLLVGDTGTGKTSAIRYLANLTNNSFRRLNLNGQTTADEFVGKILINEKGTYWTDGILTDAMRKGHWLLLDEINAGLPEILFVLQSLLDDDRYIVLSDKPEHRDGDKIISLANEVVRPHPNFRIFAAMNPSDAYTGTKELNKALMSRFPIVMEIDYPTEDKELEIVKKRFPNLDEYEAKKVIEFGNQLRGSYRAGEMDYIFSTRDLLSWIKLNEYFKSWAKSADVSILGKCNEEDKEAVQGIIKIHFATESSETKDLVQGDEFIVRKDVEIHNAPVKLREKTTCIVLERKQKAGKDFVFVEIATTSKDAQLDQDSWAVKGQTWVIACSDLEGKFTIKPKRKKS